MSDVGQLRAENDLLKEQVTQMRALLTPKIQFPFEWGLTKAETSILAALVNAPDGRQTTEALHAAASGLFSETEPKIVQVYISRLRKKLNIQIINIFNFGYRLEPESRAAIKAKLKPIIHPAPIGEGEV